MREYQSGGSVSKDNGRGRWRAFVYFREVDAEGVAGPLRKASKLLATKCHPDRGGKANNRGRKAAMAEMLAWRAELEAAEPARAREELLKASGQLTGRSTVAEHVAAHLDALESAGTIQPSTAVTYRRMAELVERGANPNRHAPTPGLGAVPMAELDRGRVQRWVNGLAAAYGATNVRKAVTLLRTVCAEAVDQGLMERDPTRKLKVPAPDSGEPNTIAPEDLARLLEDLDRPRDRERPQTVMGMKIAVFTGMRRGEVAGLRWQDVDLEAGVIHVRRAIGIGRGGSMYVKDPKTAKSRRDIPILPSLAEALEGWRAEVAAECARAGEPFRGSLYVCGEVDGSHADPRKLWRAYKRRVDRLGIVGTKGEPPKFHDIRHTFATLAIANGADVKSVSSIMGHASAAMTLNVYASADAEAKRRAMEHVGSGIAAALEGAAYELPGEREDRA